MYAIRKNNLKIFIKKCCSYQNTPIFVSTKQQIVMLEEIEKINICAGDPLSAILQIVALLQHRQKVAIDIQKMGLEGPALEQMYSHINFCNSRIKIILGL